MRRFRRPSGANTTVRATSLRVPGSGGCASGPLHPELQAAALLGRFEAVGFEWFDATGCGG